MQNDPLTKQIFRICDESEEDSYAFLTAKITEITKAEKVHPSVAINAVLTSTLRSIGIILDVADQTGGMNKISAEAVRMNLKFVKGLLKASSGIERGNHESRL